MPPGEDEFYLAIFSGLLSRLDGDLFVSVLDRQSSDAVALLLQPREVVGVPLEWEDHDFTALAVKELEETTEAHTATMCFAGPSKGIREALILLWRSHSQSAFPLLALAPKANWLLTAWAGGYEADDARDVLLGQYKGILFIGCPGELYVAGEEACVSATIDTLCEVENQLQGGEWLEWARDNIVCTTEGSYYELGDPRLKAVRILGKVTDLALSRHASSPA